MSIRLRRLIMLAKRRYWYTNKIRNPRGEGGTIGVIGSGGVLPTNWATTGSLLGLTISYVGQSTVGGLPAVRVRYQGTASATSNVNIQMETPTYAGAAPGQAFGVDTQVALVAGSIGDATLKTTINGNAAGGGFVEVVANGGNVVPTSSPVRAFASGVVSGATVVAVKPMLSLNVVSGTTYDFTLDFIAPKLVQLAVIEGPEGISNSGPFVNTTGWAQGDPQSILSAVSGNLKIENGDASAAYAVATVATAVGAAYKVSYNKAVGASAGRVLVRDGGGTVFDTGSSVTGAGVAYFVARQTSTEIVLTNGSDATLAYFSAWSLASAKLVTPGYMPASPILPPVGMPGDSSALL